MLTDATGNTTGGSNINRTFTSQKVRYVKLKVTGASGYTGSLASILDFEIICAGETDTSNSCDSDTNLALDTTIIDFSSEQNSDHSVSNLNDGKTGNRWSASGFPQYAVLDLGDTYNVNEINLVPYDNRAYQFIVEGSESSATSGFSMLTNATGNTTGGSNINRTFTSQKVRYVKLTITGASGYTGTWSSVKEFQVICSGSSSSKGLVVNDHKGFVELNVFPNPFTSSIRVEAYDVDQTIVSLQLVDLTGRVIASQEKGSTINNLDDVVSGMYLLQIFDANGQIKAVERVVKE